ncbi:MAG TPA: family 20 glycosylhydrolase, partial [Fimbriimonas sp.]
SKFIHVGGDEVDKSHWQKDPRTQEIMKQRGLKNVDEVQSWIIRQMDAYLASKGRRLVGWDEILQGGLAPGATVMSWRGVDGGIAAARAGQDVIMTPTSHLYLDYYQAEPSSEPVSIGGYLPIETVYSFEPIPKELSPEEAKHILGIQGQLWTEYIPNIKHLEYMAWPRLAAVSEVGWSSRKDLNDFMSRVAVDMKRLEAMGVNHRRASGAPITKIGEWKAADTGVEWFDREWDVTPALRGPGSYILRFIYTDGPSRLMMSRVELLRDGEVVATDEHEGYTGWWSDRNGYTLVLSDDPSGRTYRVRARIRADEVGSNGAVYLIGPETD